MRYLIVLLLFLAKLAAADPEVNFLNWAQYIDPDVPQTFTKKTGITVNQSFYNGSSMLEAKLMAGSSGYDVIVPALVDMQDEIKVGLLEPLHKDWLPNYKLRNKGLYKLTSRIDPNNNYGVIYQYGTTGIAYNPKMIKRALGNLALDTQNWDMLLSAKYLKHFKNCGVSLLDSPTQVYGIVLHHLGLNPNSKNIKDYEKATDYLMSIRQYITYFSNFRYRSDLASGNICIAMSYSGDALEAQHWIKDSGSPFKFTYMMPKNGVPIWFDMLAIPKNAPNLKAAHAWINYLMEPKVIAKVSNFLVQPNGIPASTPYLSAELSAPNATPSADTVKHAFLVHNIDPSLKAQVSRLWFKVKYGA